MKEVEEWNQIAVMRAAPFFLYPILRIQLIGTDKFIFEPARLEEGDRITISISPFIYKIQIQNLTYMEDGSNHV